MMSWPQSRRALRAVAALAVGVAGCTSSPPVVPADAAIAIDATLADALPPCGGWPRTADSLRAALGERGRWTAAWPFDDPAGVAVAAAFGQRGLVARGTPRSRVDGAWPDDCAIYLDSIEDGLALMAPTDFDLGATGSLAVLISARIEGAGLLASKRGSPGGPGFELAVLPGTGQLRVELSDGVVSAATTIPLDHRGVGFVDVLAIVDRRAQQLRVASTLGRSPVVSLVGVGSTTTPTPFTFGATADRAGAPQVMTYAALATEPGDRFLDEVDDALATLRIGTGRPAPTVRVPAGFPWLPPWSIARQRRGRYTMDVDPRTLRLPTTADLWVAPTGDDLAAGTAAAPLRSVHAALSAMTQATTIHLAAGTYDADAGWFGAVPQHDVNLIAEGGRARLTAGDVDLVWLPSAGGPAAYEAMVVPAPYAVIEAETGHDPWLAWRASVNEVVATPGSWSYQAGLLTVRPWLSTPPAARVQAMPSATLGAFVNDRAHAVYLEGLDLEGGYKALHVEAARQVILVDVSLRYGAGEGLSVRNTDEALAFGAVAEANAWDGLAYTATARILEVDCVGRDNGRDGSNIDNGSTVHDGGAVIRIGGTYRDNLGPNVADVQGARSWNLGTAAGGNRATQLTQRVNFYIDGALWLREASASDDSGAQTTDLFGGAATTLHVFDSTFETVDGAGVLDGAAE